MRMVAACSTGHFAATSAVTVNISETGKWLILAKSFDFDVGPRALVARANQCTVGLAFCVCGTLKEAAAE